MLLQSIDVTIGLQVVMKTNIQCLLFRYSHLLKVQVPGREIPADAQDRVAEVLPR